MHPAVSLLTLIFVVLANLQQVTSAFRSKFPAKERKKVTVVEGQNTRINCSTNASIPVIWYKHTPGNARITLYTLFELNHYFVKRFSMFTSIPGHYDVLIKNVQMGDAGIYECIEQSGFGRSTKVLLAVKKNSTSQRAAGNPATEKNRFGDKEDAHDSDVTDIVTTLLLLIVLVGVTVSIGVFTFLEVKKRISNRRRVVDQNDTNASISAMPSSASSTPETPETGATEDEETYELEITSARGLLANPPYMRRRTSDANTLAAAVKAARQKKAIPEPLAESDGSSSPETPMKES